MAAITKGTFLSFYHFTVDADSSGHLLLEDSLYKKLLHQNLGISASVYTIEISALKARVAHHVLFFLSTAYFWNVSKYFTFSFLIYLLPWLRRTHNSCNDVPSSNSCSRYILIFYESFLPQFYLVGTNNIIKEKDNPSLWLIFWNHCVWWWSRYCNEGCCREQEGTRN